MKKALSALVLLVAISCNTANKSIKMNSIILKETTVEVINGARIGCANIGIDTFLLPNNTEKEGLSAELIFLHNDERITVGKGSQIEINGKNYTVDRIEESAKEQAYGLVYLNEI